MESKLLRIQLEPCSREKLDTLVSFMKQNPSFPKKEMEQKGYFWDSIFLEEVEDKIFLYMVLKSEDFSSIMVDEVGLKETPFRKVYEDFRSKARVPDTYKDIEEVFCFNDSMVFIK